MNGLLVRHKLIDRNWGLVDLARKTKITYDRLVRILNGYRPARDEEIEAIARALRVSRSDLRSRGMSR